MSQRDYTELGLRCAGCGDRLDSYITTDDGTTVELVHPCRRCRLPLKIKNGPARSPLARQLHALLVNAGITPRPEAVAPPAKRPPPPPPPPAPRAPPPRGLVRKGLPKGLPMKERGRYVCIVCRAPLEYAPPGRPPAYCQECKK